MSTSSTPGAAGTAAQLPALQPPWRIGVDVGGTFTDMVLRDAAGRMRVVKVPSVPANPSEGVLVAVRAAAAQTGLAVSELLGGCRLFVHGSTIATNTMLEGKGARVGLLATRGFRDSLEIRRGIRENQWDHRSPFPPVLVPRYLRMPVTGRMDQQGREIEPLQMADVTAAARTFKAEGVESVAICLLNSFLNPAHEQAAAAALAEAWGGSWISVSSDIVPVIGEYERGSTTVVNACLAPKVVSYLTHLNEQLVQLGLPHQILLLQSNGGAVSVQQVSARPVNLVLSGPAAGVGALNYYRAAAGTDDLIAMEIGGTSCDVTLMADGNVAVSDALLIAGYHVATPSVEIHTVGAGGGTIAGVDEAGMLFAGPRGAGARPGPACYGFGGEEPTVTDAQLVLGRLRPGPYADGAVVLDLARAQEAIRSRVAAPLGIDVETGAVGIIRLLEQNLLHAVETISTERGHNPRRFTLVAAGGAGPMHGAVVGRRLGCTRVYVPRQAGAFCAIGMLNSDVRQDYLQVFFGKLDQVPVEDVEARFAELEARARDALTAEGFDERTSVLERELDLRYPSQQWSVRVRVPTGQGHDPAAVRSAFEAEYDRQFGHIQPAGVIEFSALRVVGRGLLEATPPAPAAPATGAPQPLQRRPVYYEGEGWRETDVYLGSELRPGHDLPGPLLVEEQTTTVVVGPRDRLQVDAASNYVIHLPDSGDRP